MHRATLVSAAFLLSLTSRSLSAPLDCPDLLRPLDRVDARHLEGRWAMIAGSLSLPPLMERLRRRDSATLSFSSSAGSPHVVFRRQARVGDKCHYSSYNITLQGNGFAHDDGNVTTTFVRTSCPDCILVSCDVESGTRRHFYLFSRRRQLERREMEEFTAQVECLRMPPPVVMEPAKELCPEEPAADPTAPSQEEEKRPEPAHVSTGRTQPRTAAGMNRAVLLLLWWRPSLRRTEATSLMMWEVCCDGSHQRVPHVAGRPPPLFASGAQDV